MSTSGPAALLGRTLHGHGVAARITEVEAYGGVDDPASHAFTRTPRSEIMYGPPWRLYVYRSYGMHFCANVVTGPTDRAAAVLSAPGEIVDGIELAQVAASGDHRRCGAGARPGQLRPRPGAHARRSRHRPAGDDGVRLGPEPAEPPPVSAGPRVGISRAADVPWRFWITGDPTVSAYRRSPRAL